MSNSQARTPDPKTVAAARAITAELPAGELKLAGVSTPLPEPIAEVLRQVLELYAAGKAVSVISRAGEMTPNAAADFLNVSRGFVAKLMDDAVLPFRPVGAHRRIPTAAVIAYDVKQRAKSDAAMTELVRLSQEMGLYDADQRLPKRERSK